MCGTRPRVAARRHYPGLDEVKETSSNPLDEEWGRLHGRHGRVIDGGEQVVVIGRYNPPPPPATEKEPEKREVPFVPYLDPLRARRQSSFGSTSIQAGGWALSRVERI